jgi:hypothetical protein
MRRLVSSLCNGSKTKKVVWRSPSHNAVVCLEIYAPPRHACDRGQSSNGRDPLVCVVPMCRYRNIVDNPYAISDAERGRKAVRACPIWARRRRVVSTPELPLDELNL